MANYWRIAVASLDGIVINEHFGRAKEFIIIDIFDDGTNEFVGKRTVTPLCNNGEHSEQDLLSIIEVLSDCTAVVVTRIGMVARIALEINHITVFETPNYIDTAISRLTNYYIKTNSSKLEVK